MTQIKRFPALSGHILDIGGGGEGIIGRIYPRDTVAVDISAEELDEAPSGPVKLVADARRLPFSDSCFDCATAFFSFLYLSSSDHGTVLDELHRVLKPGSALHVWDACITAQASDPFLIELDIALPDTRLTPTYGVPRPKSLQEANSFSSLAFAHGFRAVETELMENAFYLRFLRI